MEREAGTEARGARGVGGRSTSNTVADSTVHQLVQSSYIGAVHLHAAEPDWIPRQIRPPHRTFVNRSAELAVLGEALERSRDGSGPAVVVLTGLGGVGKTELVAQWARKVRDRFPDGDLYVDLADGRHEGAVDVSEALGRLLLALRVHKDYIPSSLGERGKLFRTVTAGRRLLMFVDNAEHAAEVRALLPSDGLMVVASRRRLDSLVLDGARTEVVAPLSTEAGSELVRGWLGSGRGSDHEVAGLVELCGGLPLALSAVGGQLLTRRQMGVRHVMAAIEDRQRAALPAVGGDGAVDEIFETVYRALSGPARELYHLLGIHPGPRVTLDLLETVGGRSGGGSVAEAAEELLVAHLIDLTDEPPRGAPPAEAPEEQYTCHALVRAHARRRARAEVPEPAYQQVLRSIVGYYRVKAAEADARVTGGRFRLQEPPPARTTAGTAPSLAWLDREGPNLMAVLRTAVQQGWHGEVWRLCESLWPYYHGRKTYGDWIEAHQLAVESARWDGRPDAEIRMRNQLARAYYELADQPRAAEQLDLAGELLTLVTDPRLRGVLWETQGLLCLARGQAEAAVELFHQALAANEGDAHGVIVQRYNVAQGLLAAGRGPEALAAATEAAEQAARDSNRGMAMRLGLLRGRIHDALGDTAAALDCLTEAAELARTQEQWAKEDAALALLAEVALRAGDPARAAAADARLTELRRAAGVLPAEGLRPEG